MNEKKLEKIANAINAVAKVTAWAVTRRALDAIITIIADDCEISQSSENDGYNWAWSYKPGLCNNPFNLTGRCGFGSGMTLTNYQFELHTCGGHGVTGILTDAGWRFIPDGKESIYSWGDCPGNEEDGFNDSRTPLQRTRDREDLILAAMVAKETA